MHKMVWCFITDMILRDREVLDHFTAVLPEKWLASLEHADKV